MCGNTFNTDCHVLPGVIDNLDSAIPHMLMFVFYVTANENCLTSHGQMSEKPSFNQFSILGFYFYVSRSASYNYKKKYITNSNHQKPTDLDC